MSNYRSIIPELEKKLQDLVREQSEDTNNLIGCPYPYTTPGPDKNDALYYWDTYFINLGLLRLKKLEQARHNAENLISLQKRFGFIPASTHQSSLGYSQIPLLPWIIRDIYRATGDKEWLNRMLPDVINEFKYWTTKPHTSPSGLYRFAAPAAEETEQHAESESCWLQSARFQNVSHYNPVDLNALLYRNARLIFDLEKEANRDGSAAILKIGNKIKELIILCWNHQEQFYFDNNFEAKTQSPVKALSGFMPLFTKMIDQDRAKALFTNLKHFWAPGGLTITDQPYSESVSPWNYPLTCAPYIYFVVKGLSDYEFMEDAADIGTNWLNMVYDIYKNTGEMWEWYDVKNKRHQYTKDVENTPVMGWTAGTFITLLDTLGIE
ncbi:MAG: trehalase family glycosidase [candidate division KSB1 bacterium]|nr:trehalase family glycosidase [candidate division KSB1 bacterium]